MINLKQLFNKMEWIASNCPDLGIRTKDKTLDLSLRLFGKYHVKVTQYLSAALCCAFLFSLVCFILTLTITSLENALLISLLGFSLTYALFLIIPKVVLAHEEDSFLAQLPFFLRDVSYMLDAGVPFEKAVFSSAKNYGFKKQFSQIKKMVEHGHSFVSAYGSLLEKTMSEPLKEAHLQILSLYLQGGDGKGLRKISDGMITARKQVVKEHVAKMSLVGLGLLLISVIAPLFLFILYQVGPAVLSLNLSVPALMVGVVILLGIFYLLLLMLQMMAPAIYPTRAVPSTEFLLLPSLCLLLPLIGVPLTLSLLLTIIGAVAVVFIKKEKIEEDYNAEQMNNQLPGVCMSVFSMPSSRGLADLFKAMAERSTGKLHEKLAHIASKLKHGMSLSTFLKGKKEDMFSRVLSVLTLAEEQGQKMDIVLYELAKDLFDITSIKREISAALSMQKYTLLGGAFFLAFAVSVSSSISKELSGFFKNIHPLSSIEWLILLYFYGYAWLASEYIGSNEQSMVKKVAYFFFMFFASLIGLYIGLKFIGG